MVTVVMEQISVVLAILEVRLVMVVMEAMQPTGMPEMAGMAATVVAAGQGQQVPLLKLLMVGVEL